LGLHGFERSLERSGYGLERSGRLFLHLSRFSMSLGGCTSLFIRTLSHFFRIFDENSQSPNILALQEAARSVVVIQCAEAVTFYGSGRRNVVYHHSITLHSSRICGPLIGLVKKRKRRLEREHWRRVEVRLMERCLLVVHHGQSGMEH
ncbi:hypothetical protein PENTCL1PPCAC_18670, partial [Pristionchus entomophagus]